MATNDEIVAKLPAVLAKLQETNERSARDAALAEKRKLADLKKQQTIANKKGAAKTRADLDAIQELKDLRKDIKDREAQQAEIAKSSAGQAMALKKQLEDNGKIAEDNKEFQELSYQARKEDYAQRLKNATSPAAKKEIREEARADAKKNGSRLDKIAAGIGGLFEMGKKGLKTAALGGMALLSTLAIGAMMIALGKFLQSDSFKKITAYIKETIIPKVMEFWEFLKDNWKEIGVLFAGVLAAFVIVKAAMIGAKIVKTIKAIGVAFTAVKAFFASTMLPAVTAMMIPLLPFIAIGAAIGVALYALWEAFKDAKKTFDETGSIGEALKVGISKFIGTLLGFIPNLVLKLVGWVAGLFGFDDFKKKVKAIDPIEFITKKVSGIVSKIVDWFVLLFKDPIGAIKELVKGYIDVLTDFAGFVYKKAIKPIIDWVGNLFGVKDASKSIETYVGKFLDPILNFAEGIYNKYVKPIVDWVQKLFKSSTGKDEKMSMLSAAGNMIKDFVRNIFRSILPSPDTFKFKLPKLKVPFVGTFGGGSINLNPIPSGLYKFAGINPETGEKIPDPPKAVAVAAEKIGSDKVVQGMEAMASEAVKRDASSSAAAAPVVVNTDARQTSNVNTTGPSGNNRIQNERYGGLAGSAYAFEGF